MPLAAAIERRHRQNVGHLRNLFVFLNQLADIVQLRSVETFASLRLRRRFGGIRHGRNIVF